MTRSLRFPLRVVPVVALALLAGACSTWQTYVPDIRQWGVYKVDVNQGNFITSDMVEKLKVGQNKQQVRVVLGTPLLLDPFHSDRWDYVYQFRRDGRLTENRRFTVYFAEEKLARWEGDELPVSAAQLNRLAADRALPPEPSADDQGFFGRIIEIFKGNW